MKYGLFFSALLVMALAGCNNAADKIMSEEERNAAQMIGNEEVATMTFESDFHDFGDIAEGTLAEYEFEFKNSGNAPLVITNAKGSCGCTVPDYPRTPIAPGEKGKIKVSFDSNGRPGKNDKTVTIDANTVPRTTVLKITSNVIAKTQE